MIEFGVGSVLRIKKVRHLFSTSNKEYLDLAHPDSKLTGVFLMLGFERIDCTGPRVDVNDVLRSCGWIGPKDQKPMLPIGTEVDYQLTSEFHSDGGKRIGGVSQFIPAKITGHVEGWYELEFLDGSKATVRPSSIYHTSDEETSS